MMRTVLVLITSLCACGSMRFADRGVVWRDVDDAPIAKPRTEEIDVQWNGMRDAVFLPLDRVFAIDYGAEAIDVNALDEVPDSSWFRDPRRDAYAPLERPSALSTQEMEWGAASPEDVPVGPFRVVKGKSIGATRGFIVTDARDVRYLFKLDPPGRLGLTTSVELLASRLAWACGWRVPSEVMIRARPADFAIDKSATILDRIGQKRSFTRADLVAATDRLPVGEDGSVTMLASRWLPGVGIGAFRYFGRRRDDPNDRYPHEQRRVLRGFGVFAAWVNDADVFENNTLDMYEGTPGHGHVVHYQQDVGGSFGAWGSEGKPYWMGLESYFDVAYMFRSAITLGIVSGHWEDWRFRVDFEARADRSPFGGFDWESFDPRRWRSALSNPAFVRQTKRDRYWGAKRIALFDRRELRAAISTASFDDVHGEILLDILWKRREKILRAFFGDVTALDYFRIEGTRLCFDDLWVRAGLGAPPRYSAREGTSSIRVVAEQDGAGCVEIRVAPGYRVVELLAPRGDRRAPAPVRVHFVNTTDAHRIIGVER